MEPALSLLPDLVPEPVWAHSAYRLLAKSAWKRIRLATLDASGSRCEICGVAQDKGMICDEVWTYDDAAAIGTLSKVQILCRDCSGVKHIGQTAVAGYRDVAFAHMAKVNGTTVEEARVLVGEAMRTWRARSQHRWTVRVAPDLLNRYPELAILDGKAGEPGSGLKRLRAGRRPQQEPPN